MWKNVFATGMLVTVSLSLASGPQAWAKPSDLPVDGRIQCPECGEGNETGRLASKVEAGKADTPASLDTVTPWMVPAFVGQLFQQLGEFFDARMPQGSTEQNGTTPGGRSAATNSPTPSSAIVPAVQDAREQQAAQLFKIAESCRQTGAFQKARTCYQQVHLLTPTSQVGRMAIDRLVEIEERMRETTEESDLPDRNPGSEDQSFREMGDQLIPLGLVEVSY